MSRSLFRARAKEAPPTRTTRFIIERLMFRPLRETNPFPRLLLRKTAAFTRLPPNGISLLITVLRATRVATMVLTLLPSFKVASVLVL